MTKVRVWPPLLPNWEGPIIISILMWGGGGMFVCDAEGEPRASNTLGKHKCTLSIELYPQPPIIISNN